MADDEDDDQEQDETPEPPQRLFTLTEAERTRRELEPFLVEAMDSRKKLSGLENELSAVSARIMMMGGLIVPYEKLAAVRMQHEQLAETLKSALNRILETGCLIKDLDVGLLDFPAVINKQDVYLCWKLGEDRIRFLPSPGRRILEPQTARPRATSAPATPFSNFYVVAGLPLLGVPPLLGKTGAFILVSSWAKRRTLNCPFFAGANCERL